MEDCVVVGGLAAVLVLESGLQWLEGSRHFSGCTALHCRLRREGKLFGLNTIGLRGSFSKMPSTISKAYKIIFRDKNIKKRSCKSV